MRALVSSFTAILLLLAGCGQEPSQPPVPAEPPAAGAKAEKAGFQGSVASETDSPRKAWELYRKRLAEKDWEGALALYSAGMQEKAAGEMKEQRERWKKETDWTRKEPSTRLPFAQLIEMSPEAICCTLLKALQEKDDPSAWIYAGESLDGPLGSVRYKNAEGKEETLEFLETKEGWRLISSILQGLSPSAAPSKDPGSEAGSPATPREAWERFRKCVLEKDLEGLWSCLTPQAQSQMILNAKTTKETWKNKNGNEVEQITGLTYAELLRKEDKDLALLGFQSGMRADGSSPSSWVFLDEKIEDHKATVKFRIGRNEPAIVFVKTDKGWLLSLDDAGGRSRIGSNEASAQASLKCLVTGQEQFKSGCCVDLNANGSGEYGFLDELGGTARCRTDNRSLRTGAQFGANPYIPRILGTVDARGVSQKAGYCFICYLPADKKSATSVASTVDVATSEIAYIAYAWPVERGKSGVRLFVIDMQGQIYSLAESPCSGPDDPPRWDLAFKEKDTWSSYIDDGGPGQTGGKVRWVRTG